MSFRINTNVNSINALRVLNQTQTESSKTMTRLSTGLRINDGSDDPAGLIFSENLRAQIDGTSQAVRNNQDALNFAKTADGALDEVSTLLREARTLTVAAGNHGILSSDQKAAYQVQMNLLLNSIDRVASTTKFGKINLLDGSSGVNAVVVDSANVKSMSFGGTIGTQSITSGGAVTVNVTQAATKASYTGTNAVAAASLDAYQTAAIGSQGSFSINGTTIQMNSTDTWGDVVKAINAAAGKTGVTAEATYSGGNGQIVLRSTDYGANAKIDLVDATGVLDTAPGSTSVTGLNAIAQIGVGSMTPVTFTGGQTGNSGLLLTDQNGNEVQLTEAGNKVGSITAGQAEVGQVNFQVGSASGEVANLSIGNFSTNAMGLTSIDVTTATGVQNALNSIDHALDELNRRRGDIGSFMRDTLESNIRSLGVTQENLSSTESAVRDIDVAAEMTSYTKLQILTQSGMAMLAQANQAPNQVLTLLRGS